MVQTHVRFRSKADISQYLRFPRLHERLPGHQRAEGNYLIRHISTPA